MTTEQHWQMFDRLRAYIAALQPEQFDYGVGMVTRQCGCVAAWCQYLINKYEMPSVHHGLRDVLSVTDREARFIFGEGGLGRRPVWNKDSYVGEKGIREALRRLDLVASRYTRPTISVTPANNQADRERAFLLRCMAVAAEPVTETTE